jgi:hypothetical protein
MQDRMNYWLEGDVSDPHHPGCRFVGPASLQPPASDMLYPVRFAMVEMACMQIPLCFDALCEVCVLQAGRGKVLKHVCSYIFMLLSP